MNPTTSNFRCGAVGALALVLLCSATTSAVEAQSPTIAAANAPVKGAPVKDARIADVRTADASMAGSIDSLARSFKAEHALPALVIGIIDSAGRRIMPYGVAGAGDSATLTGDTRFEVGSVSKIFTSLLLASMVKNGEAHLDDSIASYLPDSVHAPAYRGQEITLRELATHTSGLPRLPTNIAPAEMSDPYADYNAAKLYGFLASYDLPRAPDSQYEYSNLGAGLLGFLLARREGSSYADLLQKRVLQPLGLKDTYVGEPGDSTDEQMARSHAGGKRVPFWHFGALDGAGAVRSSTSDMLRLLAAELHPASTSLADAIELSQKIRYRVSPQLALGLGWHVIPLVESVSFYWHNGGTGGARSFVGFAPAKGIGVVVLTNEALPLDVVNQFALEVARAAVSR